MKKKLPSSLSANRSRLATCPHFLVSGEKCDTVAIFEEGQTVASCTLCGKDVRFPESPEENQEKIDPLGS